jgi:Ca2+-binding EF-hand superfamily protein
MHARRWLVLALAAGCLSWQGAWAKEGAVGTDDYLPGLAAQEELGGNAAGTHAMQATRIAGMAQGEGLQGRGMVGMVEAPVQRQALAGHVAPAGNARRDAVQLAAALEEEEGGAEQPEEQQRGDTPSDKTGSGQPATGGPGPGPGGPGPMFDALFRALDADGDGTISSEEIEAAPEALKKLDKDGDGSLARSEVMPPGGPGFGPPPPERMLAWLMQRDEDQDGKLSEDEAPDFIKQHFAEVDKNGDGLLDEEEIKGSMQALMAAMGPRGPGGPGRPGPGGFGPGGPGPGGFGPGGPGTTVPRLAPEPLIEQLFATHDKDQDGQLTVDELPEQLKGLLKEMDENEDDMLSKEELKKNAEKLMAAMGPQPGGPGRPGPGGLVGGFGGPGPGGPGGPGGGAGMMLGMARQMFSGFDQNKDGKLSRDEVPADFRKNFDDLDADGDGALTAEEFLSAMQGGGQARDTALINRVLRHDEDGDGQISEEEAPEFLKKHFAKLDANSDGFLDEAELQEGIATLRELLSPKPKAKKKTKKAKPKANAEKPEGT